MIGSPWFRLETNAFAKLESFAGNRGISVAEALHHLLEAGARNLEREQSSVSQSLTKKQVTVLESLQVGFSVKEIAGQLGVSEGTVRTHIHRIRHRRDCSNLLSLRFQRDGRPDGGDPLLETSHPADSPAL